MWAGLWAALSALVLGIVKTIFDARKANPLVTEARRVGAAEAELELKGSADAQVAETTKAVDALGPVLASPDGLREYAKRDPNNRDNWPDSGGQT